MAQHSVHGQGFGPAYEVSIVKAKENGEWKRSEELKAGLPHSLSLGTSQFKAHNFMAKGSQKASYSPFLLAVVSQSLCPSIVTSTIWWRMKEFGAETERMRGKGQPRKQRRERSNRQEGGVFRAVDLKLPRMKIPPFCKGRRGNLSILKTKNILKATSVYYRNGDK